MVRWLVLLLAVQALPALAQDTTPGLTLEMEASPRAPWVQQETRLTVRLYRRSSLEAGVFLTPEIPDAVIEPLSETEPREVERNGETLQVIEKRYLLFPQRSGALEIPAPVFSGRSVYARGKALGLEVRPAAAEGWWLPARSIDVAVDWRLPDPPYPVGTPLERTVTVRAEGLTGSQLPPLPLPLEQGLEAQRQAVEVGQELVEGRLVGFRKERQVLIPTAAGPLALAPALIPWWDTKSNAPRQASLEGRTFSIEANPVVTKAQPTRAIGDAPAASRPDQGNRRLAALLLAAAVMGSAGLLLWLSGRLIRSPGWQKRVGLGRATRRLKAACRSGDPAGARHALVAWCAVRWPGQGPGLRPLLAAVSDDAADQLRHLERALYGREPAAWDGVAMARSLLPALTRLRKEPTLPRGGGLPPLQP